MRVIVSSPDGIGDFVLREPLWAHLTAAKAQLLFLTRPATRPAAEAIVPGAQVLEIPADPYALLAPRGAVALAGLAERLRAFQADRIIIAPYVHTWFDEWLCATLPWVPATGFAGRKYPAGVASLPAPLVTRMACAVDMPIESPETVKNHRLATAVLDRAVDWRSPQLTASAAGLRAARARLAQAGGPAPPFYVACVGAGPRQGKIQWPAERWAELLQHAIARHRWRFVLVGNEEERATNRKIVKLCGASRSDACCLDDPQLSFAELIALLSLAVGYVGRDTGPMHMAAALGKPVLAVFAGGCWPRFVPAAEKGFAFALEVACAGCGNFCHLPAPSCIEELPLAPVVAGLDALASGAQQGFDAQQLPRPPELAKHMERAAAAAARELLWQDAMRQVSAGHPQASRALTRRVHIGHHFFGAGNIGDDLMVAGFLSALVEAGDRLRLVCPLPHDHASQQRRFPQIDWVSYEPAARESSIRACDAWLGLGDTPFQTDSGPWMLDHLMQERAWCQKYDKPMFFLNVGVNNREAVADPRAVAVLHAARHIWARDRQSLELLAAVAGSAKVTLGADLAHVALASCGAAAIVPGTTGWVLHFENSSQVRLEALEQLWRHTAPRNYWQVQEIRPLAGGELAQWNSLARDARDRAHLELPAYDGASVDELLKDWTPVATLVSSRYHALVVGAWRGSRLVGVARNDKLAGAIEELDAVRLDAVRDADEIARTLAQSRAVSRQRLESLAARARHACGEFFAQLRLLPAALDQEEPGSHHPEVNFDHGWYPLEVVAGSWFRWMAGRGKVACTSSQGASRQIRCHVPHVIHPLSRSKLRVFVNGHEAQAEWRDGPETELQIALTDAMQRSDRSWLVELLSPAYRPCDLQPQTRDTRQLSIAVSDFVVE